MNTDDNSDVAAECSVTAMPTFQFFKSGTNVGSVVGANIGKVESLLKSHGSESGSKMHQTTGRVLGSGKVVKPALAWDSSVIIYLAIGLLFGYLFYTKEK